LSGVETTVAALLAGSIQKILYLPTEKSHVMHEEVNQYVADADHAMDRAIEHLSHELVKVRTGKASPAMLEGLLVPYYGSPTPLSQVANLSTGDSRTILIQPWEKNMLGPISRAIMEANLGFNPQDDGQVVRISVPPLTEERRRDLVKLAKQLGEDAKVGVRSARREALEHIKKAMKAGYPEDSGHDMEKVVQTLTDKHIQRIDHLLEGKEKEILTV
jgi:ribosome recycling factor